MVLRPTAKLMAAMLVKPDPQPPASTTMLGDWFATLVEFRTTYVVLAISSSTLLPVVVSASSLTRLPARLLPALEKVLLALGVGREAIEQECAAMADVAIAKTNDRSTLGVMNDLAFLLSRYVANDKASSHLTLSLKLAETPIIARKASPDRDTRRLFGVDQRP
jgi:hypothetical protein